MPFKTLSVPTTVSQTVPPSFGGNDVNELPPQKEPHAMGWYGGLRAWSSPGELRWVRYLRLCCVPGVKVSHQAGLALPALGLPGCVPRLAEGKKPSAGRLTCTSGLF